MFATAEDVMNITGKSVGHAQIRRAQTVIEMYVGRRSDDEFSEPDAHWLKVATAYQTAYEEDNPGRPAPGVNSLRQGDLSVNFESGADLDLAPRAARALKRLSWRRRASVPVGSVFNHPIYEQGWEPIDEGLYS